MKTPITGGYGEDKHTLMAKLPTYFENKIIKQVIYFISNLKYVDCL